MTWQPIETAPKDGTYIFAIMKGNHPDTGEPYVPCTVLWDSEIGWTEVSADLDEYEYEPHDWQLTHWWSFDGKYLPEPPK